VFQSSTSLGNHSAFCIPHARVPLTSNFYQPYQKPSGKRTSFTETWSSLQCTQKYLQALPTFQ